MEKSCIKPFVAPEGAAWNSKLPQVLSVISSLKKLDKPDLCSPLLCFRLLVLGDISCYWHNIPESLTAFLVV